MAISDHEGKFFVENSKVPTIAYGLNNLQEDAGSDGQSVVTGTFRRDLYTSEFMVMYSNHPRGGIDFRGFHFKWDKLPPAFNNSSQAVSTADDFYLAIITYTIEGLKLTVGSGQSEIKTTTDKYYYVAAATHAKSNPQIEHLELEDWKDFSIEITPDVLDSGKNYAKLYHFMLSDLKSSNPKDDFQVNEIGTINNDNKFVIDGRQDIPPPIDCMPSGLYFFGNNNISAANQFSPDQVVDEAKKQLVQVIKENGWETDIMDALHQTSKKEQSSEV